MIYIGVGSNISPEKNIREALKMLLEQGFTVQSVSTHYRSEPVLHKKNPSYINGVWKVESPRSSQKIKDILRTIEQNLGRVRTADTYASRTIDLDVILDSGDTVIHRDLLERNFVYLPLLELEENLILPDGTLLAERVDISDTTGIVPLHEYTSLLRSMIDE